MFVLASSEWVATRLEILSVPCTVSINAETYSYGKETRNKETHYAIDVCKVHNYLKFVSRYCLM